MIFLNRWQCKIREIWWVLNGSEMDGHSYHQTEVHHGKTVVVGRCELCGKKDFIWGDYKDFIKAYDQKDL